MPLVHTSPPRGTFKGKNMMTPDILGYFKLRSGYAELSEGTGLSRQPIFGVTVRGAAAESKLFQSYSAAVEYIESLS